MSVTADKLPSQIKRLIVIAGPSGSGKSTVIKRILDGTAETLSNKLQLGSADSWRTMETFEIGNTAGEEIENLIVHYDVIRMSGIFPKLKDYLPSILEVSNQIDFVTLWVSAPILLARMRSRKESILGNEKNLTREKVLERYLTAGKIEAQYSDPHKVAVLYQKWLRSCDQKKNASHWLVDTGNLDLACDLAVTAWSGQLGQIAGGAAIR